MESSGYSPLAIAYPTQFRAALNGSLRRKIFVRRCAAEQFPPALLMVIAPNVFCQHHLRQLFPQASYRRLYCRVPCRSQGDT